MKKYLTVLKQFLRFRKPDNLKVVVYCILTAATFWFFSALNKEYDTSVRYPVKWLFDVDKYIVVDKLPSQIQINVSGIGWNLLRANSGIGLIPLKLRLTDPAIKKVLPGNYFSNQVAEELDELRLNYIVEDSLHFNIDYKISQSFPVYIDSAHIDLEKGYRITSPIKFDADLVKITGPKGLISTMPKDTFWVSVIETNIDRDFDSEVPIQLEHPNLLQVTPQTINIAFKVNEFVEQEINLPITYTHIESLKNIFVKDSVTTIHFLVQENLKDSISANMFTVEADFNTINKADSTLILKLKTTSKLIINPYFNFPQIKVYYNE